MLNVEKYKEEIKEIRKDGCQIGRDRNTHKLFKCEEDTYTKCDVCIFNVKNETCSNILVDWLLEEAPKYTLSQFEYQFLKQVDKKYKFIARNLNGDLAFSTEEFEGQSEYEWYAEDGYYTSLEWCVLKPFLTFITWTNGYYEIQYILENCEVLDDE